MPARAAHAARMRRSASVLNSGARRIVDLLDHCFEAERQRKQRQLDLINEFHAGA